MQRLIRSFNTLTDDLREKLQEQYPDGIDNSHIRTLNTPKGDSLRVIELRTSEAIYLIKISAESREEIEQFLDQEEGGPSPADDLDGADADGLETPEGGDDEEEEKDEDVGGDEDDEDADEVDASKAEDEDED
jgi:DNA-directed RNA polymerase subunit delta